MNLNTLALAMHGRFHPDTMERGFSGATIDSRDAGAGSLFFALKGSRTDGHDFVPDVVAAGGTAVVSRGSEEPGVIVVEDVERALLDAAACRRGEMQSTVVAISGSTGKTTTRLLLTAALACRYSVYSTKGNLNNQLGLPLTILNAPEPDPDMIILEMGMNHAGELLLLGRLARPHHSLITNIGLAHLEFFNSREEIARAKAELIATTEPGGICVVPRREGILVNTAEARGLDCRFTGSGGDAWVREDRTGLVLEPWGLRPDLRLKGLHNAENACSALLMAAALSVDPSDAVRAMEQVDPASGRGRIVSAGGMTILDESYNANPDSVSACLEVLGKVEGDRGAVLGDMRELGESANELHSAILIKADSLGLRFIILTGPIFGSVSSEAVNTSVHSAADWKEALAILRELGRPGTTVLVKGSNSLRLEDLVRTIEEED